METLYVTYGCGTNQANCFSVVKAPDLEKARGIVWAVCGPNFAFTYPESSWVVDGVSQEKKYGLREIPLQPQYYNEPW